MTNALAKATVQADFNFVSYGLVELMDSLSCWKYCNRIFRAIVVPKEFHG
jgi:hypothetical protein